MMLTRPNDAQVGDKVAGYKRNFHLYYKWNGLHSRKVMFGWVSKVSTRKITVEFADGEQMSFKTSNWQVWGEERHLRSVELVDEATGLRLQRQIDEEVVCKTVARDANETISKLDLGQFGQYLAYLDRWSQIDLKNAIETRKQAMQEAILGFDKMIATLEKM